MGAPRALVIAVAGFGLGGFSCTMGGVLLATTSGGVAAGVGVLGLLPPEPTARLDGLGVRGLRWHSVHPSRKRVTASRGRKAYVSVI